MVFVKRPLAVTALAAFMSFCILANLGVPVGALQICVSGILSVALLSASFLPKLKKSYSLWLRYLFLVTTGIFLSLILLVSSSCEKELRLYSGKEATAECVIEETLWESSSQICSKAKVSLVDGESADFYIALITDEKFSEGSVISAELYLSAIDSGGTFDQTGYYRSKGIIMTGDAVCARATGRCEPVPFAFFRRLNESFSEKMALHMSKSSASLTGAVVLGNKQGLSDTVRKNFSKIGISHLIAVSGMHVSFISAAFQGFTKRLFISKKSASLICILLMLFYMGLTGFSASAVRASLLSCLVSLMALFGICHDGVTALGICGFGMLMVWPHFAFDTGMQLSFFAYMGCLAAVHLEKRFLLTSRIKRRDKGESVSEKSPRNRLISKIKAKIHSSPTTVTPQGRRSKNRVSRMGKHLLKNVLSSLLFTLVTVGFTLPVMWLHYDSISVAAPIANLIFIPLFSLIMYMGLGVLLLSPIGPLYRLMSSLTNGFVSFVLFLTEKASETDGLTVSLNYPFAPFLILAFFVCLILSLSKTRRVSSLAVLGLCLCVSLYGFGALAHKLQYTNNVTVTRLDAVGGDGLLIRSGDEVALCDISRGSASEASRAVDEAMRLCETEIDTLILTGYENGHKKLVSRLVDTTYLKQVYLPYADDFDSLEIQNAIYKALEGEDVKITTLPRLQWELTVGDCRLSLFEAVGENVLLKIKGPSQELLFLPSDLDNSHLLLSQITENKRPQILMGKGTETHSLNKTARLFESSFVSAVSSQYDPVLLGLEENARLYPSYYKLTFYLK